MNIVPEIAIKSDGLAAIGSYTFSLWTKRKIVLISDKKSFDIHGSKVLQYLTIIGFDVHTLILDETYYTVTTAKLIHTFLKNENITKTDGIIGLGNETLCQLSGFVSATYLGGLPLIQIPTTLIAQFIVCAQKQVCLLNSETTYLHTAQTRPDGIMIDSTLTDNLSKEELTAAQTLMLNLGFSQDHVCRHELRKKERIIDYQLNYELLFDKFITDTLISNKKIINKSFNSHLQSIYNKLLAQSNHLS
ncbi:hypothetical protein [Enterococcus dongliensis]|uniref:hypothetical protein n=1 Tax=Enterococcus dongliensis TaxID=2559925 RepID=UPI002892516E|nr:hypothetical protein [Enterococcus dongliensis]MDT2674194.1 hypothetical protein [Enterococcus dongliensis]